MNIKSYLDNNLRGEWLEVWIKIKTFVWRMIFVWPSWIGGFLILSVVWVLWPVKKIRFGHLYTSRIGHLCFNVDNYIYVTKKNKSNEIGIFTTDEVIANHQIIKMWMRSTNIIFSNACKGAIQILKTFFSRSPLLINFCQEMHILSTTNSVTPANLCFLDYEEKKGREALDKIGIKVPFVCFHNRDNLYLEKYGQDGNLHDFRNSRITDYVPAIKQLTALGYHVLRMGQCVSESLHLEDEKYVNYTEMYRSEFMDVYLMAKAAFTVGTNTGFSQIPVIFRRAQILVNYIPFKINELTAWAAGSIIIPKKLYSKEQKRFLTFAETERLDQDIHYQGDFYRDHGLDVIDNTSEEIYEVVKEMEARLKGVWVQSQEDECLQKACWDSFADQEAVSIVSQVLKTRMGAHFLRTNPYLIG